MEVGTGVVARTSVVTAGRESPGTVARVARGACADIAPLLGAGVSACGGGLAGCAGCALSVDSGAGVVVCDRFCFLLHEKLSV